MKTTLTILVLLLVACASREPLIVPNSPTDLCAAALAMTREVQTEAGKLGITPEVLAKRACSVAMVHLYDPPATVSVKPDWLPLEIAGAPAK